ADLDVSVPVSEVNLDVILPLSDIDVDASVAAFDTDLSFLCISDIDISVPVSDTDLNDSVPILNSALLFIANVNLFRHFGLASKSNEPRSDTSSKGIWARCQAAFFDIKGFDPFATSYCHRAFETVHKRILEGKIRQYSE
ncbi:hypothetical protein SK128_009063, partial [Halocaridina rubra]